MKPAVFALALSVLSTLMMTETSSSCDGCDGSCSNSCASCKSADPKDYDIQEDDLGYDSKLEVCHLYYGQWPTGIAVSKCGRKFSCYAAVIDADNTNDGCNCKFQVAELKGFDKEIPYPDVRMNNPPGGAIDYSQCPPRTKGLPNFFLGVNSLHIDCHDILWVLDAGRANGKNQVIYEASPGGTKLCAFDLCKDFLIRTYTFPCSIAKPNSYFSDFSIDTKHNKAYITDSLSYTIVVLDLCSGDSWKALENHPSVSPPPGVLPFVWGNPSYATETKPNGDIIVGSIPLGAEAITLSSDAQKLYYSQLGGRILYSVDTACLQTPCTALEKAASTVENHGERGPTIGLEHDSRGIIWSGNAEQDAIAMHCPRTETTILYIRDKRINWAYSFSAACDGYMYFTVNQLSNLPLVYPGKGTIYKDRRVKPYVLFRFKLPGGATKSCCCCNSCCSQSCCSQSTCSD